MLLFDKQHIFFSTWLILYSDETQKSTPEQNPWFCCSVRMTGLVHCRIQTNTVISFSAWREHHLSAHLRFSLKPTLAATCSLTVSCVILVFMPSLEYDQPLNQSLNSSIRCTAWHTFSEVYRVFLLSWIAFLSIMLFKANYCKALNMGTRTKWGWGIIIGKVTQLSWKK